MHSDGWEYAHAYHWMVRHAEQGNFIMVMPDLETPDAGTAVYVLPGTSVLDQWDNFAALLDAQVSVRVPAFCGLATGAHEVAIRKGATATRDTV